MKGNKIVCSENEEISIFELTDFHFSQTQVLLQEKENIIKFETNNTLNTIYFLTQGLTLKSLELRSQTCNQIAEVSSRIFKFDEITQCLYFISKNSKIESWKNNKISTIYFDLSSTSTKDISDFIIS